jgi:hypothetical protein
VPTPRKTPHSRPPPPQANLKNEVSIPGLNTAITEVEVSKEAKLRKIEETEAVKRRLLEQDAGWWVAFGLGGMGAGRPGVRETPGGQAAAAGAGRGLVG